MFFAALNGVHAEERLFTYFALIGIRQPYFDSVTTIGNIIKIRVPALCRMIQVVLHLIPFLLF